MIDVVVFDDRGGFGPTWNREIQVGGAEMHQVQLAEFLAASGRNVVANCFALDEQREENGVLYIDSRRRRPALECRTLIIIGCASIPEHIKYERAFAFQVVDPYPETGRFNHLMLGRVTLVCVSEWQAGLFRGLGHHTATIPVPIPDEWYGAASPTPQHDFVCISSWNKGARETIAAWRPEWGSLAVGSPYSQPDDAEALCAARGISWLGTLLPRERWIAALQNARAVARVCTIGETFGVTDAAARAMGIPAYTLCTGPVGSLIECGAAPFADRGEWERAIRERRPHPVGTRNVEEFRASRVLPRWLDLIGG